MTTIQAMKIRKSAKIEANEIKALKAFRKRFTSEVECAEAIGISRMVFNRMLLVGSASQSTVELVREFIVREGLLS